MKNPRNHAIPATLGRISNQVSVKVKDACISTYMKFESFLQYWQKWSRKDKKMAQNDANSDFFCKNNLCLYIAKEKYKIRGDKSDYISKYQVIPYSLWSNPISSVQQELSRQTGYWTLEMISHFSQKWKKCQNSFLLMRELRQCREA